MDGIKAHCMGMEFPKRDTDSLNTKWVDRTDEDWELILRESVLPNSADLDAVAEEQKVKEQTSGKTDLSQP